MRNPNEVPSARDEAALFCVSKLHDEEWATAKMGHVTDAFIAGWESHASQGEPQNTEESFEGYLKRTLGENYSSIVIDALDALGQPRELQRLRAMEAWAKDEDRKIRQLCAEPDVTIPLSRVVADTLRYFNAMLYPPNRRDINGPAPEAREVKP